MKELRKSIDDVDKNIVLLLAERLSLARRISEFKKERGIPLFQPKREKEILVKITELAKEKGLREDYVKGLFSRMIEESK
ncbi:MAG: chorismate mutase, partial [Candidatus Nanoarchaeia archaeon]